VKMESIVHGRGFNNEGIMHGVLIFKAVVECASLSRPLITFGITIPHIRGISSPLKIHLNANLMVVSRSTLESDPGGYRWPPTFSDWLKTVFWQFWQFTIFSRF
jgi:hypothetical protein